MPRPHYLIDRFAASDLIKRVSDEDEAIVVVPVVVEPVVVQITLRVVPVEVEDVRIAVIVLHRNVRITIHATTRRIRRRRTSILWVESNFGSQIR